MAAAINPVQFTEEEAYWLETVLYVAHEDYTRAGQTEKAEKCMALINKLVQAKVPEADEPER